MREKYASMFPEKVSYLLILIFADMFYYIFHPLKQFGVCAKSSNKLRRNVQFVQLCLTKFLELVKKWIRPSRHESGFSRSPMWVLDIGWETKKSFSGCLKMR